VIERMRADRLPNRELAWYAADALLVVLLGYFTIDSNRSATYVEQYGRVVGSGWIWVLGPTALILVRRTIPATALALATLMYLVAGVSHGDGNSILAAPFLAYTVALTRPPRVSAAMVATAGLLVAFTGLYGPGPRLALAIPVVVLVFGVGWAVGVRVRTSHDRAGVLAARAEQARREAAESAHLAVVHERARIARELHDAVGHAVNVMVMQAGAARMVTTDERSATSFREIERVGRSALLDLDRMLGLLRDDGGPSAPLEPAHGLVDIGELVDGVRAAGADVVLDDRCTRPLDPDMERPIGAAAYRIVQEALTNAVKHAGPASIRVVLSCDDSELVVSVVDDGRGAASVPSLGGRGIAGMKERVAVLGGTLAAGPRPGGGYSVEATFPRPEERR
jgi:signal transduction histidine kinase